MVVDYPEAAVLGDDGQVRERGWGEGKGADAVVGEAPGGYRVGLLILGCDGFVDVEGRVRVAFTVQGVQRVRRGQVAFRGRGAAGCFGSEGCIVALLVVHDECAVQV